MNFRNLASPGRLAAAGLGLLLLVVAILWLTPSKQYIFLPDEAHATAPVVRAEGERPSNGPGGVYYVDVLVRKATLLERLFPSLREGSTLVPASAIQRRGVSDRERRQADRREMARSQDVAAAVALRALGFKVRVRPLGARVAGLAAGAPAAGKLHEGDIVVGVDGKRVRSPRDLRRLVSSRRPGDSVRLQVRSGDGLRSVRLKTIEDPRDPQRPVIGVVVDQAAQIDLPINVEIDVGEVGGPSAGLAFALDLMEELGRDVDRGYRVAATGQIELDGTVIPVGGVKQKTIGARESDIEVFLVPAGDNAREARRYASGLRVIPVKSFRQALRALATLRPER
ncbi:MAG: PDZ domain-containing protein [Actinobacteria bacterium]|nr:PDZ domain-containing protein [Actinomycetota bacterium]